VPPLEPIPAARWLLEQLGVEGVSAVAVVVLLAAYIYSRRAAAMGGKAVSTAGSAGSYLRAFALLLLVLLIAGVASLDVARAAELLEAGRVAVQGWLS
jgi:hypothetical protein